MLMEGIITPVVTPFRADGSIDRSAFGRMLEHLISAGVHSVIVGGSTGEFYAQTLAERVEMMEFGVDVVRRRIPVMAGVSASRTEDSIMLATAARDLGLDGLLVGSPPYAAPTEKENALHACGSTGRPDCRSCSTTTRPYRLGHGTRVPEQGEPLAPVPGDQGEFGRHRPAPPAGTRIPASHHRLRGRRPGPRVLRLGFPFVGVRPGPTSWPPNTSPSTRRAP